MSEAQAIIAGVSLAAIALQTVQAGIAAAQQAKDQTAMIEAYRATLLALEKQLIEQMQEESNHREDA
jgi:hypothetical protein